MKNSFLLIAAGCVVLLAAGYWFFMRPGEIQVPLTEVPIEDSLFAQEGFVYKNATKENIRVELPFPGAVVGKPLIVRGEARAWYFEATFPVEVLLPDGEILAQGYAEAQEDWMRDAFVPFHGEIAIPESYIGNATLILRKSNASGLPEHDASVSFPIVIEY